MSPREVTEGLAAAVVAAGPPPAPILTPPWSVRPLTGAGEDAALVSRWMNEPHVERFWEQAWPPQRWSRALAGQLAGDFSRPFLISYEAEPFAYVEIYRTPRDVVGSHYEADPYDLGLHLAIGDAGRTGKGLGRAMVRAVARGLARADGRSRRLLADPDERHVMARRMFVGAGFHLMSISDLGHKRAALHICDLSPDA